MAFLVSPGVEVKEKDLTNIIPAVSTSIGGFAGVFQWGPALEATTVSSESNLISQFGYPIVATTAGSSSRQDWYTAANFLDYSNNLSVVRVLPDGARNAASESPYTEERKFIITVTSDPGVLTTVFYNGTNSVTVNGGLGVTQFTTDLETALITALGAAANVTRNDNAVSFISTGFILPNTTTNFSYAEVAAVEGASSAQIKNLNDFLVESTTLTNGSVYARYPGKLGNGIGVALIDATCTNENAVLFGTTKISDLFDDLPGTSTWATANYSVTKDEIHVVVYTTDTTITGNKNEVLETYAFLSKAKNAKTADGGPNYYVDVVNNASSWVYLLSEQAYATGGVYDDSEATVDFGGVVTSASTGSFANLVTNNGIAGVRVYDLRGGQDGTDVTDADYIEAYNVLADVETVDVSLLITGARPKNVQKHVIDIAEKRKDCIAFVSPDYASAVTNPTAAKVVEYFNNSTNGFNSTSYAVFDSGWKRQYDRHNDEYFWIPLNSDIAGLTARTEYTNDAWWSPAGLNRGFIKNVVKLSFNPTQTDRDILYPKRINPVVTFRGQGTLLYGDKTALSRPSAFDRINVRRLFIILEKAIATAAKYQLFEFNDDITRRVFVNAVEPFLADIKSRRGLTDFKVVCDTSNNTSEVIDGNRFVADIYIKPARSINFITLNFVAVRTGVSFSEVAGA